MQNSRVIRFSSFEADLRTRELRKHGLKLKLQDQPFQVLVMLLERPGELITREEIRTRLWPQDTFVDFDHALNAAVRRLRDALNDNPDTPRFVETLPRRGYRFIAPVQTTLPDTPPLEPGGLSHTAAAYASREKPAETNGAATAALEVLAADSNADSDPRPPRLTERRSRSGSTLVWLIAGVFALGALLGSGMMWLARAPTAPIDNPLANAQFTRLTNFDGVKYDAALSPDGKLVAFRADRDGPSDIWLTESGSGQFINLTHGLDNGIRNQLRSLGFSGDGSEIWLSGRVGNRLRLMPVMGGQPRPFLRDHVVNVAWSPDGAHIVYHTNEEGDPTFVADRNGENPRQIFIHPIRPGGHAHFPTWSSDGRWIYVVAGIASALQMDLWRIPSVGGRAERLTHHNSDVEYPTPIDARTVLYIAPDQDGSGPWLWALDVERKLTRRVSFGLEQFKSIAASADGRRLVATVANPSATLWSVPILDRPVDERDVKQLPLPSVNASAPRFGPGFLFYLSPRGAGNALWRYQDGKTLEIWNASNGPQLWPPGVSPDGRHVAIAVPRNGKRLLHVLSSDGAELQSLAPAIDVQGSPCWSPDGRWIAVGGSDERGPGLFKIPTDGGVATRLVAGTAINPVWSGEGNLIVYAGAGAAAYSPLLAVRPDGSPIQLPTIQIRRGDGERARFLPGGKGLVYMQGLLSSQDFWLLDLITKKTRQLARLENRAAMLSFDITPDGKEILFDRLNDNSEVVLIDRPNRRK